MAWSCLDPHSSERAVHCLLGWWRLDLFLWFLLSRSCYVIIAALRCELTNAHDWLTATTTKKIKIWHAFSEVDRMFLFSEMHSVFGVFVCTADIAPIIINQIREMAHSLAITACLVFGVCLCVRCRSPFDGTKDWVLLYVDCCAYCCLFTLMRITFNKNQIIILTIIIMIGCGQMHLNKSIKSNLIYTIRLCA